MMVYNKSLWKPPVANAADFKSSTQVLGQPEPAYSACQASSLTCVIAKEVPGQRALGGQHSSCILRCEHREPVPIVQAEAAPVQSLALPPKHSILATFSWPFI